VFAFSDCYLNRAMMARTVVFQLNIILKQEDTKGGLYYSLIDSEIAPISIIKNTLYLPGTDQGSAAM
jgi:hypothetical protein